MGFILMWSGAEGSIPSGAKLCDGTNSTPNLKDRFIIGAYSDGTRQPGTTGGNNSYSHTHSINSMTFQHTHTVSSHTSSLGYHHTSFIASGIYYKGRLTAGSYGLTYMYAYSWETHVCASQGSSHSHTPQNQTIPLPPYYALAFIMIDSAPSDLNESGIICMWSGSVQSIPSGWVFCDGNNSTPDLRDKFLLQDSSNIGSTGGNKKHTHGITDGQHAHTTSNSSSVSHTHSKAGNLSNTASYIRNGSYSNWGLSGSLQAHNHTLESGGGHTHTVSESFQDMADYPQYYALAYIMKT